MDIAKLKIRYTFPMDLKLERAKFDLLKLLAIENNENGMKILSDVITDINNTQILLEKLVEDLES